MARIINLLTGYLRNILFPMDTGSDFSLYSVTAGCTDTFTIDGNDIGAIKSLKIQQTDVGTDPSWLVDHVEVKHGKTGIALSEPVNRSYTISEYFGIRYILKRSKKLTGVSQRCVP